MVNDPIYKILKIILCIIAIVSILLALFGKEVLNIQQYLNALHVQIALLLGFQALRDGYSYFKSRDASYLVYAMFYIIIMFFYWLKL